MTTSRSRSEEQTSDDEQNVSALHPTSIPHPVIERSTSITDESDFAIYLSLSTLVNEGAQSQDLRSSLRTRQDTPSPDSATPEAEHSSLPSENPSDDELSSTEPHNHAYQTPASVNTEEHTSDETLHSHEEPTSDDARSPSSSVVAGNFPQSEWLPYTLRWQSLTLLVISTAILLLLVVTLWWRSVTNNGLGTDDGSSMLLFGWRFTPPLLAVLYVQMTAMLLDDVKRTECFARMARPGGSTADASILRAPGAWWNALADGLSKHGGRRSWLLFFAACLNVIGFLAISPLSSSFLELTEVMSTTEVDFTRITTLQQISLVSSRETKLRILGHILQGISTSAWISDNYTVIPFWPTALATAPLGPELPGAFQTWQAETVVLSTQLDCNSVSLLNITAPAGMDEDGEFNIRYIETTWLLSSGEKCEYTFSLHNETAIWKSALIPDRQVQQSEKCAETELILIVAEENKTRFSGHACTAKYYFGEVTVTAHVSSADSSVVFDEKQYLRKRRLMPGSFLRNDEAQNASLDEDWSNYLPITPAVNVFHTINKTHDLSALLWATYDFNFTAMTEDSTLISRAEKVKQRVFGEILQYSLQKQGASTDRITGKTTKAESRITVTAGVAAALASFLWISLILQLVVWSLSRIRVRPLNIMEDPATTICIAALFHMGSQAHENLRKLKHDSQAGVQSTLGRKQYCTTNHKLYECDFVAMIPEVEEHGSPKTPDWRPLVLRLRTFIALGLYLATLITAVLVLHHSAQKSSLYRTAFVYQAKIPVCGVHTLTPFSLIPTLLGVIVGLWWGSVDAAFRRLQPYLSMSEASQSLAQGASLSYQSSYWVWAAFKAASKKHGFLLLVTTGTSLSPILTIAMSALLERTQTNISTSHQASRPLELRQIPHLFVGPVGRSALPWGHSWLVSDLYTTLPTNWLYSATLQLTMGGFQLPWSRDSWSFTPIDLAQFSEGSQTIDSSSPGWAANVSIITPAIRGRLECSTYKNLDNVSTWLTLRDLRNTSEWNASTIPHAIEFAYQPGQDMRRFSTPCFFNTSYLADGCVPNCCTNGSNWPPPASALGSWSLSESPYTDLGPPYNFTNLTIKWIYGSLVSGLKYVENGPYTDGDDLEYLMFLDVPSAQALDCTPIIETSSARVTVDQRSGSVNDFKILEDPREASKAFTDNFLPHPDFLSMTSDQVDTLNITVSYGIIFLESLLHAASLHTFPNPNAMPWNEQLDEQAFNFRDTDRGLNLDLMTYAMYALAGKNPKALLDAPTMEATAQKTFTTFFQHFVSSNVSLKTGSWAYQPINATLPPCLTPYYNRSCQEQPIKWPVSHTNRTVDAQISRRVSELQMNAVAVWLSVGILAWLIATTVIVAAALNRHLRGLKGDVERVADVLLLVAGSDKLLRLLKERGERELAKEGVMTKLGWFEDRDGQLRWGIEVVEEENESEDD